MNEAIYAAADRLTDEQRRRDMGAFFGSVHLTLTHILIADRVWLERFGCNRSVWEFLDAEGKPMRVRAFAADLYPDFSVLRSERVRTDAAIESWAAALRADDLDVELEYSTSSGETWRHPLWWSITHFFNHQTHHRGQVTTLLKQCGVDPGVTDFVILMRERFGKTTR